MKLVNTVIGDVWLLADDQTLIDHPYIVQTGLPLIFFAEIERFSGKTVAELAAIGIVETMFPTERLQ